MKSKKDIESLDELKSIPETFNFPESENQKGLLNENFVFKFEENEKQTGNDINPYLDDEDNKKDDPELRKEDEDSNKKKELNRLKNKNDNLKVSSTRNTISAIAASTAVAVVLVVGGSIAISQGLNRPSICEFDTVTSTENSIDFALALGNDRLKIDSGEENDECELMVELLCPSQKDFVREVEISNFGIFEGRFSNLEADTEYTLNVYQDVFLLGNKEYLMPESYSISTSGALESTIAFYKEETPLGDYVYYAEVFIDKLPDYLNYQVRLGEKFSGDDADDSNSYEWMYEAQYDVETFGKQLFTASQLDEDFEYFAAFIGINEGDIEQNEDIILSTTVKFSDIVSTPVAVVDDIYISRYIETTKNVTSYKGYVSYTNTLPDGQYQIVIKDIDSEETVTEVRLRETIANATLDLELNFGTYSEYGTYNVIFGYYDTTSPSQSELIELISKEIDFDEICTHEWIDTKPVFNGVTFTSYAGFNNRGDLTYAIDYSDPNGYWSNFTFEFFYSEEPDVIAETSIYQFYLEGRGAEALSLSYEGKEMYFSSVDRYNLTVTSTENGTEETITLCSEEEFSYDDIPTINPSGCTKIKFESEAGTSSSMDDPMNVTIYAADDSDLADRYESYVVKFTNQSDETDTFELEFSELNVNQISTYTLNDVNNKTYLITTYGYTSGSTNRSTIYIDTIDIAYI